MSKRIDPELTGQIVEVLIDIDSDSRYRSRLDHGLVDRFVPVGPTDYDDIRRMLEACENAGFLDLR